MPAFFSDVILRCVAALSLTMILVASALAQDATSELRVATYEVPPFVMKKGDKLIGFSIDLWEEIAARLKLKTSYQAVPDVGSLIEAVQSKNADIGVSAIFYTVERDKVIDFSYPILETGLQVMVRDTGAGGTSTPLRDLLALLISRSALMWVGVGVLIILVPAHVVWLLDRGTEDGISPSKNYFPGIFYALVWAATALVSQVQQLPSHWLARVLGLFWMFGGVVFIALYTAQLTATLTVEQIRGDINGPGDLPGKRVATLSSATATTYLRDIKAEEVQEFSSTDEVFKALLDGKADAVLLDAPILSYYAANEGRGKVRLVGPEVNRDDLGFLFQLGDPLRKRVGNVLIALREDGTYQRIYDKWFGGPK